MKGRANSLEGGHTGLEVDTSLVGGMSPTHGFGGQYHCWLVVLYIAAGAEFILEYKIIIIHDGRQRWAKKKRWNEWNI
jgi:hypothetical protein